MYLLIIPVIIKSYPLSATVDVLCRRCQPVPCVTASTAVSPIMCALCDGSMFVCISICVPPVSGDGGRALEREKQE
jgi:hypothetical protein